MPSSSLGLEALPDANLFGDSDLKEISDMLSSQPRFRVASGSKSRFKLEICRRSSWLLSKAASVSSLLVGDGHPASAAAVSPTINSDFLALLPSLSVPLLTKSRSNIGGVRELCERASGGEQLSVLHGRVALGEYDNEADGPRRCAVASSSRSRVTGAHLLVAFACAGGLSPRMKGPVGLRQPLATPSDAS